MIKTKVSPRDTCKHCGKSFLTRYTRKRHEDTGVCQKASNECVPSKTIPEETSLERRSKVGKILVERAILNPSITSVRSTTFLMNKAELSEMKQNLVKKLEKTTYKWAVDILQIIPENKILVNEINDILVKYKLLNKDDKWGNRKIGQYVLLSDGVAIEPTDDNNIMIYRLEDFIKEPEGYKRKTKPLPEQNKLETQLLYGEPEPSAYKDWKIYQGFYGEVLDEKGQPKIAKLNKTDHQLLKNKMRALRKNINILTQIGTDQMFFEFTIVRSGLGIHASANGGDIFTTNNTPLVSMAGPLPTEEGPARWFINLIIPNKEEEETSSEKEQNKRLGYPQDEMYVTIRDPYKQPDPEFIKKMTTAVVLMGLYPNIPEKIMIHVIYPKNKKSKSQLQNSWKDLELDIKKTEDGKTIREAEGYNPRTNINWARFIYTIPKELRELLLEKKGGKVRYKNKH